MKSKNIIFVKPNVAELIEENIDLPRENEVQVQLFLSTISKPSELVYIPISSP